MFKIISVLILITLSGCSVTPEDFKKAEEICNANGGLEIYFTSMFVGSDKARCKNGVYAYDIN